MTSSRRMMTQNDQLCLDFLRHARTCVISRNKRWENVSMKLLAACDRLTGWSDVGVMPSPCSDPFLECLLAVQRANATQPDGRPELDEIFQGLHDIDPARYWDLVLGASLPRCSKCGEQTCPLRRLPTAGYCPKCRTISGSLPSSELSADSKGRLRDSRRTPQAAVHIPAVHIGGLRDHVVVTPRGDVGTAWATIYAQTPGRGITRPNPVPDKLRSELLARLPESEDSAITALRALDVLHCLPKCKQPDTTYDLAAEVARKLSEQLRVVHRSRWPEAIALAAEAIAAIERLPHGEPAERTEEELQYVSARGGGRSPLEPINADPTRDPAWKLMCGG